MSDIFFKETSAKSIFSKGGFSNTIFGKLRAVVLGAWILATGFWDDSGVWDDAETWND